MTPPPTPIDETKRLATLRALRLLDSAPDERFDRITRIAARLFDVPMALVSLVDEERQWFKSRVGADVCETARDISFCGHALEEDSLLVVPQALDDARFFDNPFVAGDAHVRFYAGCPIKAPNGARLGTLCIADTEPRSFSEAERGLLLDLGAIVEREIATLDLALTDEMTGLHNRRALLALGEHALGLAVRRQEPLSLLFADLDGLKRINDTWGHAEGDRAIVDMGHILARSCRRTDVVTRLGGDEFCCLLIDCDAENTHLAEQRILLAVSAHNARSDRPYALSVSLGIIGIDANRPTSLEALIAEGDRRMYERKGARRAQAMPAVQRAAS